MVDPGEALAALVAHAIEHCFGDGARGVDPMIRRFDRKVDRDEDRADLQADVGPRLARTLGVTPQQFAERVAAALPANDLVERAIPSPSGFVSFVVRTDWLAAAANRARTDDRLGVPLAANRERVVIDYSAPNVAKEMHVGHMRSTIIGDALARVLEWRGNTVIRQNHLGDWGTPLGMLYEHDRERGAGEALTIASPGLPGRAAPRSGAESIELLGELYRAANARYDSEPEFAARARDRVVTLQAGVDAETSAWWQRFIDLSREYHEVVYRELGVTLTPADVCAESFYNDRLAPLVDELVASGYAVTSDGAVCVFPAGFKNREGGPMPVMLRKQGGGYGYGITDLAAIRYRLTELGATRLLYVVGATQLQHLAMVHRAAIELGWLVPPARAEHVPFGLVLGPDKQKLASREGAAFRLLDLIEAAVARAEAVILELEAAKPDAEPLPADVRREVARAVGVGSIKHADLSCDRKKNYIFDLNRMVAFRGDTAGYLQYAHARVRGIFRDPRATPPGPIQIGVREERDLVRRLLELGGVVRTVDQKLEPHHLTGYLYDLALAFTAFYDACPVLTAPDDATRSSRLAIAELTARTIARGLDLLGIAAPERM